MMQKLKMKRLVVVGDESSKVNTDKTNTNIDTDEKQPGVPSATTLPIPGIKLIKSEKKYKNNITVFGKLLPLEHLSFKEFMKNMPVDEDLMIVLSELIKDNKTLDKLKTLKYTDNMINTNSILRIFKITLKYLNKFIKSETNNKFCINVVLRNDESLDESVYICYNNVHNKDIPVGEKTDYCTMKRFILDVIDIEDKLFSIIDILVPYKQTLNEKEGELKFYDLEYDILLDGTQSN